MMFLFRVDNYGVMMFLFRVDHYGAMMFLFRVDHYGVMMFRCAGSGRSADLGGRLQVGYATRRCRYLVA